jgi:AcrR family transcriptional regulator
MMRTNKKDLIVKTAQILFGRFGWHKTTVDDIARRARIGKGTIYHYFESKEQIFAEVVERENQFLREKIRESINRVESPREKLKSYILTKLKYTKELANIPTILNKDDYLDYLPFMEIARRKNYEEEIRIVREVLELGIDTGSFRIEDINLATLVVVSFLKGLEISWNIEWVPFDLKREVDVFLTMFLEGISASSPQNASTGNE